MKEGQDCMYEEKLYGNNLSIEHTSDDSTIYTISGEDGDVKMTGYQVFPGIEIVYNDVHTRRCAIDRGEIGEILEINHCHEGRIECEFKDEFFYLSQGDISISRKNNAGHSSYFPSSHYHGVSILIDINRAPDCLSCFLRDVNVMPLMLAEKFCSKDCCFVMRDNTQLAHIFSELYSVPSSIQKGYFKIKILEILLFLSSVSVENEKLKEKGIPKSQVVLAKQVSRYLSDNMDRRITTNQLSDYFHVSQTQIKTSFRSVYGTGMFTFVRAEKMREAGVVLRKTNQTILEVAGQFGYDNASKFAKAFQEIQGLSPSEYRQKKQMERIIHEEKY